MDEAFYAGIDIGTAKTTALIGSVDAEGNVSVIGIGEAPAAGVRAGVIVDIDAAARSIRTALDGAERSSGYRIDRAGITVSGRHLEGRTTTGQAAVRGGEVHDDDIERVLECARAVPLPPNRELVHVLPSAFVLDETDGVRRPLGMSAQKIAVRTHLVTASGPALANLAKCAYAAGIVADEFVAGPVAAAEGVLDESERALGAVVVDLGAGTTAVAVVADGAIVGVASIPVGGAHVARDVAVGLRLGLSEADALVRSVGGGLANPSAPDVGPAARGEVLRIAEARLRETCELAAGVVRTAAPEALFSGVILTGGAASLDGLPALAAEVFGMPCRVGYPVHVSGLIERISDPSHAAAVGILRWMARTDHATSAEPPPGGMRGRIVAARSGIGSLFARIGG